MAKRPNRLVKANSRNQTKKIANRDDAEVINYIRLVEQIKKSKVKAKVDAAFNEIIKLLKTKLEQISYKFKIPGLNNEDIYQESLFALRYKAIKDYDSSKSEKKEISPFDKFAILCIRRHLSTKLKSSYQNKQRVWISSISLDQDRNTLSEDSLFLSDIISDGVLSISDVLDQKENDKSLYKSLYSKLSHFEKIVFLLYCRKLSYHEITGRINKGKSKDCRVNVKSIDNAIARVKQKGREIFKKHEKKK